MLVESYTAIVLCDDESHPRGHPGCKDLGNPVLFVGRSRRKADEARAAAGWVRVSGCDICPLCAEHLQGLNRRTVGGAPIMATESGQDSAAKGPQ